MQASRQDVAIRGKGLFSAHPRCAAAPRWHAEVWGFHVAIDRSLGYGLKTAQGFQPTHLGFIGKQHKTPAGS